LPVVPVTLVILSGVCGLVMLRMRR
jgi:hypothetical protein